MKGILWTIAAAAVVLTAALPFAVPPIVTSVAESKLAELGFPSRVSLDLGYAWRGGPELDGSLRVAVTGSPWSAHVAFGVGFGTWHADLTLPETLLSDNDLVLSRLLRNYPLAGVSNLTFSGSLSLSASVRRTRQMPVPVWSAKAPIRFDRVSLMADDKEISASGIALKPAVSGIAGHADVAPLRLSVREIVADGFLLTNVYASARVEEKAILVTEAGARTCGGKINLYSLFLNPESLNAGLTLFVDNVDAGEALGHFKGFSGDASGRLHGKIRLFVREGGKAVRLNDAFLYSTPGETGTLQMREPEAVTDNLAMAGIDAATCANVANALRDLDYTVLRLDLKRLEGKTATLGVRIEGTATRGDLTVPVNLNININGELEQLINTGLGFSNKLKENRK